MTKKFLTATALACALIAPTAASAAKIEFKPCNTSVKGCYAIMIDGDILEGDGEKFIKEATEKNVTTGIVNLNSYGGHLQSGLMIGLEIKERKLQTFVGDEWTCVSVCADMWLAGSIRYYGGAKTRIGFHGAYWLAVDKNGKPAKGAKPQVTSSGNAAWAPTSAGWACPTTPSPRSLRLGRTRRSGSPSTAPRSSALKSRSGKSRRK